MGKVEKNEEFILSQTINDQFEITIEFENVIKLKNVENRLIEIDTAGIKFNYNIQQTSPKEIAIRYHYICEHVIITEEERVAFNNVRDIISKKVRSPLLYE